MIKVDFSVSNKFPLRWHYSYLDLCLSQGSAWIDKCRPDLLITESTYATTIRDSKRCRERDFLKKVHDCVEKGGKVLIPVFALGRAQVKKI